MEEIGVEWRHSPSRRVSWRHLSSDRGKFSTLRIRRHLADRFDENSVRRNEIRRMTGGICVAIGQLKSPMVSEGESDGWMLRDVIILYLYALPLAFRTRSRSDRCTQTKRGFIQQIRISGKRDGEIRSNSGRRESLSSCFAMFSISFSFFCESKAQNSFSFRSPRNSDPIQSDHRSWHGDIGPVQCVCHLLIRRVRQRLFAAVRVSRKNSLRTR